MLSLRTWLRRLQMGLALVLTWVSQGASPSAIPSAYGPHVNVDPAVFQDVPSYGADERIVGTYYFYWYDAESKAHVIDGDGTDALTTHPPTLEKFSFTSVDWHETQLRDMIAAGIDVVLPVFWGAPSEHDPEAALHWSYAGLPPLVAARERLLAEGAKPPRIGLFYDTSTLRHNRWRVHVDLTTDYGRQWFYATIRDFFSMIPARHWAMIEGRPIVLLYSVAFAKAHDQSCIDHAYREFPREFGGRVPWIAREISWNVAADQTVAWGGALGMRNPGIASVGPGYDHSAVPGRQPLVVDRRGGAFYEENWVKLLRRPSTLVMVETWNEFHEGTDVCESREYGRQYIELTRKYADWFRQGHRPPPPQGPYSEAPVVKVVLGGANQEYGLRQLELADGLTVATTVAGRTGRASRPNPHGGRYVYFAADDSFKPMDPTDLAVEIDYWDGGEGWLGLEFDGSDPEAPFAGAYSRSPDRLLTRGAQAWATASFQLPAARLLNGQNGGADFRLVVDGDGLTIGEVRLKRR